MLFESENYLDLKDKLLDFINNKYCEEKSSALIKTNFSIDNAKKLLKASLGI